MGKPLVCNDGVTIAKVSFADHEENLGAQMMREAAERTGETVGDGTSTATVLAHAIFADGVRNVASGASAVDLKRGLDRGLRVAVEAIRAISRPVQSRREKAQVATISAHNDPAIGEMVADATERVGPKARFQSRRPRPPRPRSKWSKACSSTAATSRLTSSPTPRRWRPSWKSR